VAVTHELHTSEAAQNCSLPITAIPSYNDGMIQYMYERY